MSGYVPKPISRSEAATFEVKRAAIDHLVEMEPGQTITIRELDEWIFATCTQELVNIACPGFERKASKDLACDVLWSADAHVLFGSCLVGDEIVFTRRAVDDYEAIS